MALAPEHNEGEARWKLALQDTRQALRGAGLWAHRVLLAGEWTWLRITIWSAGLVFLVLTAAVLWLYFLDWNTMRGPVSRYASLRLGRTVRIEGDLDVHLFSLTPRVSASDVSVANPGWARTPQAASIPRLIFTFRLLPLLLSGDTILPLVQFDRPNIAVLRRMDGRTNWDFGGGHTGWNLPPINRFLVRDGHIRIDDRVRKLLFIGAVSSEETAGAGQSAFSLIGDGSLNGNTFAAEVHGGPLINVDETRPYHFAAKIRSGATHVTADGAITHPFHLGQFTTVATLSGANLSDLYYLTGLALPHTAAYRITGTLTRDGTLYQFKRFSGVIGASDLHGDLDIETAGARPFVHGAAASRVLDFKDIGQLFGGKSETAAATGRLLPDVPLHVERLRQMDADVTYDAATIRSQDFPLRGVHTHIALKNSVLTLNPLTFQFAYGRLGGSLAIDARKAVPVSSVDARISNMQIAQFVSGNAASGVLEARARLEGTGNSAHKVAATANGAITFVVPQGRFNEKLAEWTGINLFNALFSNAKSETGLRCAVAHFDTRDGVMQSPSFIFDTDNVRIEGKGSINLRDETMQMTVVGKPKEFRIGRLHAPITISGPLAKPNVGINATPMLVQGGIAVVLGFLFPPAAVLPFVDPGLAEDANCAGLVTRDMAAGAAHVRHPSQH
jgi:uncharacterized protein involved in outer membrane biogenesis